MVYSVLVEGGNIKIFFGGGAGGGKNWIHPENPIKQFPKKYNTL